MRIGFSTIYSWRPHVEHLYFLATLARKAGHETFFLTCDADLPSCYTRELRGRPAWRECLECRAGGIRSFTLRDVSAFGQYPNPSPSVSRVPEEWARSSASTLGRFESDEDYAGHEFAAIVARLYPAVQMSYQAARAWIQDNRLDAICVFNARMDVTRAIFEAAKSLGVRAVSLERTWFGDGLQLYPDENCLGLQSVNALVVEWRNRPLTRVQALRAVAHVARRFLRTNVSEWRAYNIHAQTVPWPVPAARHKILLVPSSRNEVWGHPDWAARWPDPTVAYDALLARLNLAPSDLVLRCHPNWAEQIGKRDGALSERHYAAWAKRTGVLCIPSRDRASTLGLIEQCDAIVVANGSAALEAGLLGKQVIAIAPSFYQEAGLRDSACSADELGSLRLRAAMDPEEQESRSREVARQTVRFCYTMIYRVAQYTQFVKARTTTSFRYAFAADPQRLTDLLRSGRLVADDDTCAADTAEESDVLNLVREKNWELLCKPPGGGENRLFAPLKRRPLLRPIDLVSRWKPVGDR